MPKISTVQDILDAEDKFPIHAFRGVVKSSFPRKEGESDKGPWSFENIVVTDKDGEDIKVVFSNRDPLPKGIKGKQIQLICYVGKRGPSGLYVHDNTYSKDGDDVTVRELKVTPTAEVIFGNAQSQESGDNEGEDDYRPQKKPAERQEREEAPSKQTQSPPKGSTDFNAIAEAKFFLARRRNAWVLCHAAVVSAVTEINGKFPDAPLSPATITAMTLSLFNSGCYKDGLWDDLPVKPIETPKPKEPSND